MGKVLIATADGGYLSVVEAEISGEGHEVLWAADGKEAQELALSAQPDLVLLDAALPVFSGLEVSSALRGDPEIPGALPIVLVGDEDVDPHKLESAGVTLHARKSHGHHELRELLVDCLLPHRKH